MKQLEEKFIGKGQVKGFKFTQIKKTKYGYIYLVEDCKYSHYEVFKHKENKRFECVSYPSNKSFGIWAFTTKDINRANDILCSFEFEYLSNTF